ncbi:MEI2-like 4-like protein [Drosera capensis]
MTIIIPRLFLSLEKKTCSKKAKEEESVSLPRTAEEQRSKSFNAECFIWLISCIGSTNNRMVTMSRLENASPVVAVSDGWEFSKASFTGDQMNTGGVEGKNTNLHGAWSRSTNQTKIPIVTQRETSLFSSSLSDLFAQKVTLSRNKVPFCQPDSKSSPSLDETEAQTLKHLLPDEEELFLGMVEETGLSANAHVVDDSEDVDLFSCSGGIELETDGNILAKNGTAELARGTSSSKWVTGRMVSNDYYALHSPLKIPVGVSSHEASRVTNGSQSSLRVASVGSQFGPSDPSYSLRHVVLGDECVSSFATHSVPEAHNFPGNGIHRYPLDNGPSFARDIHFNMTGNGAGAIHHGGLNERSPELNGGAFPHSPRGGSLCSVPHCTASNSSPSERHHSGSLFWGNWPSVVNGDNGHCPAWLPGFPGASHIMMSAGSPMHQHQVGSASISHASLWERRQSYAGESLEAPSFLPGSIGSAGFPSCSPPHPLEISSYNMFPHGGRASSMSLSKNAELLSPHQMRHMLHKHGANSTMCLGSPSERAMRNRRNESNMNYADKKQYELNIDGILRGEDTRTTLMIKNIPNKYTSNMLLATINENHRGVYDFIYLPIDFKNKCNVGYAFINMAEPLHIVPFYKTFEGKRWEKFNSEKVASLAYARIQGKDALVSHFQNSSLMNEDKRCRPILFHTHGPNAGDQEPFPMGTNIRTRPGRIHASSDDDNDDQSLRSNGNDGSEV